MWIESVHVERFGRLRELEIRFAPGLTVIFGANESGKTTLAAFIRAMLFGLSGKSASILQNDRKKYMPWNETSMGGSLRLRDEKRIYEIVRVFGQTKKSDTCRVVDVTTGEIVPVPAGEEPGQALLGVDEAVFLDTLFVSSRGSRLTGDGAALGERIRNLIGTGAEDVDLNRLLDRLHDAKSEIAPRIKDRGTLAQVRRELDAAREQIIEGDLYEHETERLENRLAELNETGTPENALHSRIDEHGRTVELHAKMLRQEMEVAGRIRELERRLEAEEALEKTEKRRKMLVTAVLFTAAAILAGVSIVLGIAVDKLAYLGLIAAAGLFAWAAVSLLRRRSGYDFERKAAVDGILARLSQLRQEKAAYDQQRAGMEENLVRMSETIERDLMRRDPQREEERVETRIALEKAKQKREEMQCVRERIRQLEEREKVLMRRAAALEMAQEELREAAKERQEGIAPELVRSMEELLFGMTAGRYETTAVSRELALSVQPGQGALRSWEYFSTGTVEQMYLALRLSLVRMLSSTSGALPVLLDDPFAHYDDERVQDALALLRDFAVDGQQVLLMTCRAREAQGAHIQRMGA